MSNERQKFQKMNKAKSAQQLHVHAEQPTNTLTIPSSTGTRG
jgi:hypothetical protein